MDGFRADLAEELEQRRELTVTHAGPDGRPVSATLAYCNDGAMIYYVVPGDSEAFSGLEPDARVSLVIGGSAPRPLMMGLTQTRITLPAGEAPSVRGLPVEALIAEVSDGAERARAVALLAARYPGLGPVMQRAHENGFQMRVMRAAPFISVAPSRAANAA